MQLRGYIIITLAIVLAAISIFYLTYDHRDNDNWTAPYFSAAANLQLGGKFLVDAEDVLLFKELPAQEQYTYKFISNGELIYYNHNPIGFAYIIRIATLLFPFLGDAYALVLLQVILHILLCFLIIQSFRNRTFTIIFTILYAINPLILNIVVLNYYYFWQCIPGFIVIYLTTAHKVDLRILTSLLILLVLSVLARPTIILVSIFSMFFVFKRTTAAYSIPVIISILIVYFFIYENNNKNIWHTVYVGIAAYQQDEVRALSDDEAYSLYLEKTGDTLNASFGQNYYNDEVIKQYTAITKDTVYKLIKDKPLMFIRNAAINTLQIYSVGYLNLGNYTLNLLSAFTGLLILMTLLASGQLNIAFGILLSAITFTLYYPPIQAYLFGAYIFSVVGFFHILNYYFPSRINYLDPRITRRNGKKRILYICSNDGSDMRINKELKSLSSEYEITFVGVGTGNEDSYASQYCKYFHLIIGRRNTISTMLHQIIRVWKLRPASFDSIHIINEQLMVFFYPILPGRHVVLDIFDSIFLMWNKSRNRWNLIKRIVYAPVDVILVTDHNRLKLMPEFAEKKVKILENFPHRFSSMHCNKRRKEGLTIIYSGWLGQHRGTEVILTLLECDAQLQVIMVGWFADDMSKELAKHPRVDYRGIMKQEESLIISAEEGDYILCVYAPNNENNINASPNKIYDAIQTATPVIINQEIRISKFVEKNEIGVVFNNYYNFDAEALIQELYARRLCFHFDDELKQHYTWEHIEPVLLEAHQK